MSGVGVAQLAERWTVAPVVVGSNPIAHPPLAETYSNCMPAASRPVGTMLSPVPFQKSKGEQAHAETAGGCPSGPGTLRDVRCCPQGDSGIEAAASAPHQVACAPPRAADHPAVGFQRAREGVAWGFPGGACRR
jgi:hypothetical protein